MAAGDDSGRGKRAAEAFRALDEGEHLARRRIWRRVREGVAEDARARRRRRWAIWSGVAAAATIAAFTPALVAGLRNNSSDRGQTLSDDDIAFQAVMQTLAAQTFNGGSESTEEFVLYLVTEAQADAQ